MQEGDLQKVIEECVFLVLWIATCTMKQAQIAYVLQNYFKLTNVIHEKCPQAGKYTENINCSCLKCNALVRKFNNDSNKNIFYTFTQVLFWQNNWS